MKYLRFLPLVITALFCSANVMGQTSSANLAAQKKPQVLMSTYDHAGVVPWGYQFFTRYVDSAIDWLGKYPSFKFGLDNEAYSYDDMYEKDHALMYKIKDAMKRFDGRFGIGTCTYGQPLSVFVNEESNIRQIEYAINSIEKVFGVRPYVYAMSEHANHSQIPQIARGFGFTGSLMRTHFMMYGYNPTYDSPIGWWRGVDGTQIASIPTYKGEGNAFGQDTEDNFILSCYPGDDCDLSLDDYRDKFSHISPLLASKVDDANLRREDLVKIYEGKEGFKWVLIDDIFSHYPAPKDIYNAAPNDFKVRMPWGYCGNEIWDQSRHAEVKVLTAERLSAISAIMGGDNNEESLEKSWKNLLIAQHHDIQICGILSEARKFLPASIGVSDSLIKTTMGGLAAKMSGGDLGQITLFNPLSYGRNEWVDVVVTLSDDTAFDILNSGNKVEYEVLSKTNSDGKCIVNIALNANINPLALKSYSVVKSDNALVTTQNITVDRDNMRITTPFWIVELNKDGGINSIVNRQNLKEMLSKSKGRSACLAGVINGESVESKGQWDISNMMLNNNNLTIVEKGNIATIPYQITMNLSALSPAIDYTTSINVTGELIGRLSNNIKETVSAFLHEEKLRFKVYPLVGIGTTGIRDLPFVISETEDKYVEGNYWTAISDGRYGAAFFNKGLMGSVRESDGAFSVPFSYSMNYIWGKKLMNGKYNYEFSMLPFSDNWSDASLHRKAIEYNYPIVAEFGVKGDGILGDNFEMFNLTASDDVLLSALFTKDGKPYMRFYESKGGKGDLTIKYNKGKCAVTEVDLLYKEQKKSSVDLTFTPWQIKTVRLDTPKFAF